MTVLSGIFKFLVHYNVAVYNMFLHNIILFKRTPNIITIIHAWVLGTQYIGFGKINYSQKITYYSILLFSDIKLIILSKVAHYSQLGTRVQYKNDVI